MDAERGMTSGGERPTVGAMKGSRRQLAVLTCVGALAVSGVAAAANSGSFLDPAGDAASAPDITGVAVSSDDAGIVTVKVSVANRSALASSEEVDVGIDTDQNP